MPSSKSHDALKTEPFLSLLGQISRYELYPIRPGPQGVFVPPREGGCLTGVFESLIVWNRVVKLMAMWHRDSNGGVQGVPKAIYEGSI